MKKLLSILLIVVILTLAVAPMASAAAPSTMIVQSYTGLVLRAGPGLGQARLLLLLNGEQVSFIEGAGWKQGIQWAKVSVTRWGVTTVGYCSAAYLSAYKGYPEPTDSWQGDDGWKVVSCNSLRLRCGPGLSNAVVRTVPYGTILTATDSPTVVADGYTWRELAGGKVWAAQEFLQHVGSDD